MVLFSFAHAGWTLSDAGSGHSALSADWLQCRGSQTVYLYLAPMHRGQAEVWRLTGERPACDEASGEGKEAISPSCLYRVVANGVSFVTTCVVLIVRTLRARRYDWPEVQTIGHELWLLLFFIVCFHHARHSLAVVCIFISCLPITKLLLIWWDSLKGAVCRIQRHLVVRLQIATNWITPSHFQQQALVACASQMMSSSIKYPSTEKWWCSLIDLYIDLLLFIILIRGRRSLQVG